MNKAILRWLCGAAAIGMSLIVGLCGCATSRNISETYLRPAEINMAGRKNVVLENFKGEGRSATASITSRLRQELISSGFTVLDRDSMDEKAREEFFGEGKSAEIAAATVLIRGNVLQANFTKETKQSTSKSSDGSERYVYKSIGKALIEVTYDVVDLGTTKLITSATLESRKTEETKWATGGAPPIDSAPVFTACYKDNIDQFMRKLAPYEVSVTYKVYPLPEVPRARAGVLLFEAGDSEAAFKEFQAALAEAKTMPKIKPKVFAYLVHNMAMAKERGGDYAKALDLYVASTRFVGGPPQGANIARCKERQDDQVRLIEQGVSAGR